MANEHTTETQEEEETLGRIAVWVVDGFEKGRVIRRKEVNIEEETLYEVLAGVTEEEYDGTAIDESFVVATSNKGDLYDVLYWCRPTWQQRSLDTPEKYEKALARCIDIATGDNSAYFAVNKIRDAWVRLFKAYDVANPPKVVEVPTVKTEGDASNGDNDESADSK